MERARSTQLWRSLRLRSWALLRRDLPQHHAHLLRVGPAGIQALAACLVGYFSMAALPFHPCMCLVHELQFSLCRRVMPES